MIYEYSLANEATPPPPHSTKHFTKKNENARHFRDSNAPSLPFWREVYV